MVKSKLKDYEPRHIRYAHDPFPFACPTPANVYVKDDSILVVPREKEMEGFTLSMFRLNVMLESGVTLEETPAMRSMSDLDLLSRGESLAAHIVDNYVKDE